MPTFTGMDALRLVREQQPDVPFIFVSGTIGEETAVAAMRAGAQDYVMKGNLKRLAPAITRELRESVNRREGRAAEEQLRFTTEILRAMFDASPLAIIVTGLDGIVQLWNPAAERLLGWTEAEAVLQPDPSVPDDERIEETDRAADPQAAAQVTVGRDRKRRARDGSLIDVSVSRSVANDAHGNPSRIITLVQDQRERKRLEAQFLQAQKMEAVGQLAGGIAHDFNNLLTVITSYSEFLLEDTDSADPRRDDLVQIRSAAETAASLSRRLLLFSRNEVFKPQTIPLNTVVSSAAKLLTRLIDASIDLELALGPTTGLVEVDPGQLEQVVINLAINARDAMPNGGRLTLETTNAGPSGSHVALAVSDTGTGMDAETQARIFEPFFTTKEPGKGTGLGLSTVYSIVRQWSGTIRLSSEIGRGSTFTIHLPRADTGKGRRRRITPVPDSLRGTETILIVEDSAAVRSVARQVLERFGYVVLEAPDGETGLRVAERHTGNIELLLTDVVMPGMSGPQLAERLSAVRAGVRVLVVSGYSDPSQHTLAIQTPATYLQKPFTPEALARAVRETLDKPRK
jgi:PAS domain S-box-containing protein